MADTQTISVEALASLCNIGKRRIQQLAQEGVVYPSSKRGHYLFPSSVNGYIKYLQELNDGKSIDFNLQRARKVKYEADIMEVRIAEAKGEVIPVAEVEAEVSKAVGICAKILGSLKHQIARIAPEIPNRALDLIDKEQAKMLNAIIDLDETYLRK